MNACDFNGCDRKKIVRNLCKAHANQMYKGRPLTPLALRGGITAKNEAFWARVFKGETCWEWRGYVQNGYGIFKHGGERMYAHRYAMTVAVGRELQRYELVDHLCHNTSCVNPKHLRLADDRMNAENRAGAAKSSRSKMRGVYQVGGGRWRAELRHRGQRHSRTFSTADQANEWVRALRKELIGWP